jgi:hypothetical protein
MKLYQTRTLKLFIFVVAIVATDKLIGSILRKLYFTQKSEQKYALTYSLKYCKADILIFGSSQAQHNYISRVIGDSMKMSCYNAGQDGGHSILLQYAQIKIITKRYSPKIIILEFHPDKIVHFDRDYDRLSILLPYYKDYPEIRSLILQRSPFERLKLLSTIYPFNSNIIDIIRFNRVRHGMHKRDDVDGYIPLHEVMNSDMLKTKTAKLVQSNPVVDTNMVNALKNIIRICKEKSISLFIVSSPIYQQIYEKQGLPSSPAMLSLNIIHSESVIYFDYTYDSSIVRHMEFFKDKVHLNDSGAKVFSNKLIIAMKKTLLKSK